MKVLITGGSGFMGTNLVEFYAGRGDSVLNLDHTAPRNREYRANWRQIDLLDRALLASAVLEFQPDVVYHLGARTDLVGRRPDDYRANTEGVANLIEAVRTVPSVRRVIFASSRMVCRIGYQPRNGEDYCPPNAYGESKVAGERLVRASGLEKDWVIVRPTSIWGPWFDVPYRDFFMAVARGRFFQVGRREVRKSFGFVGNSVYELDRLATAPREAIHGRTMYLADYPPLEVRDWAERIRRELESPPIRRLPYGALKGVALLGDLAAKLGWVDVPLTSFRLDNLLTEMVHDLRPVESIAGPLPYSLDEGVAATAAWLRSERLVGT